MFSFYSEFCLSLTHTGVCVLCVVCCVFCGKTEKEEKSVVFVSVSESLACQLKSGSKALGIMAGRIIAQIIIQGAAVLTKAFVSAYQQALQSMFHSLKFVSTNEFVYDVVDAKKGGGAAAVARAGLRKMRSDEAMKVLNIEKDAINPATITKVYFQTRRYTVSYCT